LNGIPGLILVSGLLKVVIIVASHIFTNMVIIFGFFAIKSDLCSHNFKNT